MGEIEKRVCVRLVIFLLVKLLACYLWSYFFGEGCCPFSSGRVTLLFPPDLIRFLIHVKDIAHLPCFCN